jgi:hypothetical protein
MLRRSRGDEVQCCDLLGKKRTGTVEADETDWGKTRCTKAAKGDGNVHLISEDAKMYVTVGAETATHGVVTYSVQEYLRGKIHTNPIRGFYSLEERTYRQLLSG